MHTTFIQITIVATSLTLALAFAVPAAAQQRTLEGDCNGKARWLASLGPRGQAGASLIDCSNEEPPTYLSINCKRGSRTVDFSMDYIAQSAAAGAARKARFSVDGERFTFPGRYDPNGMYELLNFKSARAARFLEALQAGKQLTIFGGDGTPAVYSLKGSRKFVGMALDHCRY